MALDDFKKEIYSCVKCGACRFWYDEAQKENSALGLPLCPSGDRFGFESYFCKGRLDIAKGLIEGRLEWSERLLSRIYNCTLCRACDYQCYQSIAQRPLNVIKELRKELFKRGIYSKEYELLPKLGKGIIDYGNPFFQSNEKREDFGEKLGGKRVTHDIKTLFFIGCSATFDATSNFIARAMASIMNKAGEEWGILGKEELCCGIPLLDVGDEDEFKNMAKKGIENINRVGVNTLVTVCPACYDTIKNEWPKIAPLNFQIKHSSEYILDLLKGKRLKVRGEFHQKATIHDPCLLARGNGVIEENREILENIPGLELIEMPRNREKTWCCGAGGLVLLSQPLWASEVASQRLEEAISTGAQAMIIPSCPLCYLNFDIALHGYAGALKLYQDIWKKIPALGKFMTTAQKLFTPFLKRKEKIKLEILDLTHLIDKVTT